MRKKVLIIGRAIPEKRTGMFGIFEYQQSVALAKKIDVSYLFCDLRSFKYHNKCKHWNGKKDNLHLFGYSAPLGGLPKSWLEYMRTEITCRLIDEYVDQKGVPDIIHVHFPLLTLTDPIVKKIKKIGSKIVITEHWTAVQEKKIADEKIKLLRTVGLISSCIICVSEDLKKAVEEYLFPHIQNKLIVVVPNMVEQRFHYLQPVKSNDFIFMFAGRLEPVKKVNVLIDAFELAFPDKNDNVKLVINGHGAQYHKLKKKVKEYADENRVIMNGVVNRAEMVESYANCNCFISVSELETFGVPFIESWIVGRPIVCMANSPIRKYLNEKQNGLTIKRCEPKAISMVMKQVRETTFDSAFNISKNANNIFSENVVVEKLLEIYDEL